MRKKTFLVFIVCVSYSLLSMAGVIEPEKMMFRSLTIADGLSSNNISAVYRDIKGYLWIGTSSGLNQWNAHNFKSYYHSSHGLPSNTVISIFEDFAGRVWVYCDNTSYAYYDYETGNFNNDVKTLLGEYGFQPEMAAYIGCSKDRHYLWGSDSKRICVYDHTRKCIRDFALPAGFQLSQVYIKGELLYALCNNSGRIHIIDLKSAFTQTLPCLEGYKDEIANQYPRVYVDDKGGLWLYTFTNSLLLHKSSESSSWQKIALPIHGDQFNRVAQIDEDADGNIWIITSHHGAFVYESDTEQMNHLTHDPLRYHTLVSNNLTSLFIDKDNTVWIGSNKQGVSYYMPGTQTILGYSLGGENDVLSFCEKDNHLFIGTDGAGLLEQSRLGDAVTSVQTQANIVVCLHKDSRNRLWMGTFQSGIICMGERERTQYTAQNSELRSNNVYGIEEDANGNIWIALLDGIVQKLDPNTGRIVTVYEDTSMNIREMIGDGKYRLFAATSKGLLAIDTYTEQGHYVTKNLHNNMSIPQAYLYTLYKDSKQILWLGTSDGLIYWNQETDSVGCLTTDDGLPTNLITSITEDHNGQLWVGTYNGISCIDLDDFVHITNYKTSDGLITSEINQRAICSLSNGDIVFGTPRGLIVISPKQKSSVAYDSSVFLTSVKYTTGNSGHNIDQYLSPNKKEIKLEINQLPISLYFSTFDFAALNNISYYYRLNGAHDWYLMNGNAIYFTSLYPGVYHLEVTACNAQGQWASKVQRLVLYILPPWYRTTLAYIIYGFTIMIVIGSLILFFYRYYQCKEHTRRIQRKTEQQQKLMDMKLTFFANVSHELRTPLSLIINPLEEFIKRYPQLSTSLLSTAHSNAKYLLELINQLLSFRKIDSGGETMDYSHIDVVRTAQDLYSIYQQMAEKHRIHYTFNARPSVIKMDCDNSKFMKIIHNLLSNAFKFTPDGGAIELKLSRNENELILEVSDTGLGIPAEDREKIFNLFVQVKGEDSTQGGTGIGLYLVKQYAQMHGGNVTLDNNDPTGTVFTVTLPLKAQINLSSSSFNDTAETEKTLEPSHTPYNAYSLLVVDDNLEFLNFLSESLSTDYKVYQASSAMEALQLLNTEEIDLAICDVMMPQMDGIQFCQTVKNDLATSHIPVILLTAKAGEEFQLEGLSHGADDYITKPFHMDILKMRINKFIENSIGNHQMFQEQVHIEPSKITITPLDTQFVKKSIKIVEDNLSNADFTVEDLAAQLYLSRGYLYRKLLKITGKSPLEFIRIIRMKRAQQLLSESQMQVAEVAYQLGYVLPKTFTKHFKQEFGITPSQYLQSIKNDKI